MIRFSASLVVVGLGLLVAGGITSKLLLIYISIAVCAVALLFLIIGAIVNRAELLGREPDGIASGQTEADGYASERDEAREPAATAVGAGPGAGRGYSREHAEDAGYADRPGYADDSGYGAPVTPPDRPREAPLERGKQPASRDFAGYEQFAGDAERRRADDRPSDRSEDQRRGQPPPPRPARRPAEPDQPFADPEPTRMDLNVADIQGKGRQERDRTESSRPDRDRTDRDRSDRPSADKPFVDPNPTRMDWTTADLRDAGQQDRARPSQDRPERDRPERDRGERGRSDRQRADRGRQDQPFADPQPTRMDLNAADIRAAGRPEREAGRPERETTRTSQPAPPPAEPAQPAPTQPVRPDKLLVSRADRKTPPDQPAESLVPNGEPSTDRPAGNDAGTTRRPAEQAAAESAVRPAADPATSPRPSEGDSRPAEAGATREQSTLASADRGQAAGDGKDDKDRQGRAGSGSGSSAPADEDLVTVVPGVPRYHRSDCILIRFMGENDLQRMPVERARESGCTPCRACQPDGDEDE